MHLLDISCKMISADAILLNTTMTCFAFQSEYDVYYLHFVISILEHVTYVSMTAYFSNFTVHNE